MREVDLPEARTVQLGRSKSMLVEVPRELKDIVVSAPDTIEALLQSSNRVYLIGKKSGQANVFFFDSDGEQFLTLEIVVEPDTAPLDALLRRLLPAPPSAPRFSTRPSF